MNSSSVAVEGIADRRRGGKPGNKPGNKKGGHWRPPQFADQLGRRRADPTAGKHAPDWLTEG